MNCAGCNNIIRGVDYLECTNCHHTYHSKCVNSPSGIEWLCPICTSKVPKGDDTIIRSSTGTPTGYDSPTMYVSQRKKRLITDVDRSVPTVDDIRAILREELQAQDSRLGKRIEELSSQLNDFRQSMDFLSEQYDKLRNDNISQQAGLIALKKENENLRSVVSTLTTRLNQMDQVSRASNIEIQCVPENKGENLVTIIKQIGRVVNCPVNDSDIHHCTRVAKMNPESPRPRNILVKLSHPRQRDTLLAAVITYNKKHPDEKLNTSHLGIGGEKKFPVYITENLSPENKSLHASARKRAKELNYKFVWVRAGKIFMRKSENSGYIFVRDMDTLAKIP